jgi:hypothetical protein
LACGDPAAMISIPSFSHIRPNCVTGSSPRNCSRCVGARLYTFFQSTYSACGTPFFSIHARNVFAAAQIVSSSPSRNSTALVASSVMFIRQPSEPRPSNQS